MLQLMLPDEQATSTLAACLARALTPGLHIQLIGDLGAGKTTLVRGVLRALGFRGRVKSPSYSLIEPYEVSSLYLYHLDLYRLNTPRELIDAGLRDVFGDSAVCFVEWPQRGGDALPAPDVSLELVTIAQVDTTTDALAQPDADDDADAPQPRQVTIKAYTQRGNACLTQLAACWSAASADVAPALRATPDAS